MPVLDQFRDNPVFMQSLKKKRSKPRIIAPTSIVQRPTADAVHLSPTTDVVPDAAGDQGVSEVTSSMATMFSQDNSTIDNSINSGRQQRAPTADTMTALSHQRRLEVSDAQAQAAQLVQPPHSMFQQDTDSDDSMGEASDEESTGDEIARERPREASVAAVRQPGSMRAIRHSNLSMHPVKHAQPLNILSTEADEQMDEGLFVSANPRRAPTAGPDTPMWYPAADTPLSQHIGTSESQNARYAAEVARLEARRDEEDGEFLNPNPENATPYNLPDEANVAADRPRRQRREFTPPRKRPSSEIRRETIKKPRAVQPDDLDDGQHLIRIKGKRYSLLKEASKVERCGLISDSETAWGKGMIEVIPKHLWPRDKKNVPLEPRDWPKGLLEKIRTLADFTPGKPEVASIAIQQAISARATWYSDEQWLYFTNDADSAIKMVLSGQAATPAQEGTRVDSPLLETVGRSLGPTSVDNGEGASSGADEPGDSDTTAVEEDLYNSTPQPQRRAVAGAIVPVPEHQAGSVEVVDLTMDGPDEEDTKQPIAFYNGMSGRPQPQRRAVAGAIVPVPEHQAGGVEVVDLTMDRPDEEDTKQPIAFYNGMSAAAQGGSIVLPQGSNPNSLSMIMRLSRDLSGFTTTALLDIRQEARDWNSKADRELRIERREAEDFADLSLDDVFNILDHTHDVQKWIQEEIKSRKMGRSLQA